MTNEKQPTTKPVTPKPVCPFCNTAMKAKYFTGYYESFPMWTCKCKKIPGSKKMYGNWA